MWGGKVSTRTISQRQNDGNCSHRRPENSSLPEGRLSALQRVARAKKSNKGDTIKAKTHAEIGTIAHLSIIGVEDLGRPNSKECIEALDILALYWCRLPSSAQNVGAVVPINSRIDVMIRNRTQASHAENWRRGTNPPSCSSGTVNSWIYAHQCPGWIRPQSRLQERSDGAVKRFATWSFQRKNGHPLASYSERLTVGPPHSVVVTLLLQP